MPAIVIVPTLCVVNALAVNVAVIVTFPLPLDGFIVSHDSSSVIVQVVFELIVKVVLPDAASTSRFDGSTDKDFISFCVIVTV